VLAKHVKYVKYITRHKFFVGLQCCAHGIAWRGIKHDWHKFLPNEWLPYANHFFGKPRGKVGYYKPVHSGDVDPSVLSRFDTVNVPRFLDQIEEYKTLGEVKEFKPELVALHEIFKPS